MSIRLNVSCYLLLCLDLFVLFLKLKHVFMNDISFLPIQLKLKSNIIYITIITELIENIVNQFGNSFES